MMRAQEWPPSRPRARSPERLPSWRSKFAPQAMSSRMQAGASRTTVSTAARLPRPQATERVSAMWESKVSCGVPDGGDATLGVVGIAFLEFGLGDEEDVAGVGGLPGRCAGRRRRRR